MIGKYRAWDDEVGEMSQPFTLKDADMYADYELLQYTGLKDKNGVEVYEKDLLRSESGDVVAEVLWQDGAFYIHRLFQNGLDVSSSTLTVISADVMTWWEVIGNIYENKELLK